MKNLALILISVTLSFTLSAVLRKAPEVNESFYMDTFNERIEALKKDIQQNIVIDLKKNYAKIDTIKDSHGVAVHVLDFRERTGDRLPDLGLGLHSLK